MTDYRDGNWHVWTGGDCPVHLQDRALYIVRSGSGAHESRALELRWSHLDSPGDIVCFRVVERAKDPAEPQEYWFAEYDDGSFGEMFAEKAQATTFTRRPVKRILRALVYPETE